MKASVPHALVADFITALGADPAHVTEIVIEADHREARVTVTELRTDDQGHYIAAGDFPATTVTQIRIEPKPRE